MVQFNINQLLMRRLLGKASDEELAKLEQHAITEDIQEIVDADDLAERYAYYAEADVDQALCEMQERMAKSVAKTRILSPRFYRIAAVLLILLVGGAYWFHREYTRVTPPVITEEVQLAMEQSRESGRGGADIISAVSSSEEIISEEEYDLYHVDEDFAKELEEAKRITTYHDKEFWVTLDDGTLVHLNYNSRLIYPEKFGDSRDVILEGEAYFMVAKDKSRKFVVHTPQGDIKVYGTEFIVNTRENSSQMNESLLGESKGKPNHQATTVVLVEGSIGFTPTGRNEMMIIPGQKLYADKTKVSLEETDTTPYTAWNTGLFVFKKSTLEDLMNVVSQWYAMKNVSFADDSLRKIHFTGKLKRYGSIDRILEAIMMTCDLNIYIQDETIKIEKK